MAYSQSIAIDLDINLAILDAILPNGATLSTREIAEIIGSTDEFVNQALRNAKAKIRRNETLKQLHRES